MDHDLKYALLVTCEHATCTVPGAQRSVFEGREDELHSEAGWEPGALNLAQAISIAFRTPIIHGEITRLILDLEATESEMWGKYAESISPPTRDRMAERLRNGYRNHIRQRIHEDLHRHDAVVHLLVHVMQSAPGRIAMRVPDQAINTHQIATRWATAIHAPMLQPIVIHGGFPGDLVAETMRHFDPERYLPIRLEVDSSSFIQGKPLRWDECKKQLITSLATTLDFKI